MSDLPSLVYTGLCAAFCFRLVKWLRDPLRAIPTVGGPSFPFLSFLGMLNFMARIDAVLQDGYKKYSRRPFKAAMLDQWVVFVSSPEAVQDVGRRPESELSLDESMKELFQADYTVTRDVTRDPWHAEIIRTKFARDLFSVFLDLVDELPLAMDECFPAEGTSSRGLRGGSADLKSSILNLVSRLATRVCVGTPACRSPEYRALVNKYDECFVKDAMVLKLFPDFMRPIVARLATSARSYMQDAVMHLQTMYQERKDAFNAGAGTYPWFVEEAPEGASDEDIIHRVLTIHITIVHSSPTVITQALSDLASYPEHAEAVRTEVEALIAAEGWTKGAANKMRKLDSFLKESQRCHCVVPFVSIRKAVKDVTLTDGTFLPQGTMVAAVASPIHHDETLYPDPNTFDPFRFSRMADEEGPNAAHRFTHSTAKWLTFGNGRHACPGRFFAADLVKVVVAYILLNYDLELKHENWTMFGIAPSGNLKGRVTLKRRKT